MDYQFISQELLPTCFVAGLYAVPLAFATSFTLGHIERFKANKEQIIISQDELSAVVLEEAEKRGVSQPIQAVLHEFPTAYTTLVDGVYQINLGGIGATRGIVKHELNHIAKGDIEARRKLGIIVDMEYFFWREPRASLYNLFDLKL